MSSRKNQPHWWQLYVMLPLLTGLFLLEMRLHLTGTEHIVAQLGILALIYAFLHIWLRANRSALIGMEEEEGEWRIHVYEIPPARLARADRAGQPLGERPMLRLPEAGLKGVLDTTFESNDWESGSILPAGSETLYSEELVNAGNAHRPAAGIPGFTKSDLRSPAHKE